MHQADTTEQTVLPSPIALVDFMETKPGTLVVSGDSAEAEGDRLLVSNQLAEALERYQAVQAPDCRLREKMAFILWALDKPEAFEVLGSVVDGSSDWGLIMHLRVLKDLYTTERSRRAELDQHLALLVEHLGTKSADSKYWDLLMSGALYLGITSTSRSKPVEDLVAATCKKAGAGLKAHSSPFAFCMEVFDLWWHHNSSDGAKRGLEAAVERIDMKTFPILAIAFKAAYAVTDRNVMSAAIAELCSRHSAHPKLLGTVVMAAIEAKDRGLIDHLPGNLREQALELPDTKVLLAIERQDSEALQDAIGQLHKGYYSTLSNADAIVERLFAVVAGYWQQGNWTAPFEFLGERAAQVAALLPASDLRDRVVLEWCSFGLDEEKERIAPLVIDLFNRRRDSETFSAVLELEVTGQVDVHGLADYIYESAVEEEPLCPFDEYRLNDLLATGVGPILESRAAKLPAKARRELVSLLAEWGLVQGQTSAPAVDSLHPSDMTFSFQDKLNGKSLDMVLASNIQGVISALKSLAGEDLVYLQAMLTRIAHDVSRMVPAAAAEKTVVDAIDEVLALKEHHLNDYGHERARALVTRYGAPSLLEGVSELCRSKAFSIDGDILTALSTQMVSKQGSLAGRRSYLAGILRKRLKNLKGNWLDQQVSECLNRGIDIEQMIELAKKVSNWDEWTDGLASLRPY